MHEMRKIGIWAVALAVAAVLGAAATAWTQPVQVTVVMKSGERHTGQHLQYRPGEFSLRKSLHDQLRPSPNQVAYVDFGGAPDVAVSLSGSQEAVVLKNGTVVRGQVLEMGHENYEEVTTPFYVTIRDEQGRERRFPASEVGRVYLEGGATTAPTTGASTSPARPGEVVVQGNQQWTATGITVKRGETLRLTTTGEIRLSENAGDVAAPAGSTSQRRAQNAPMPEHFAGALIGRIGPNGRPFGVGNQTSVTMPDSGQLFLGINDDHVGDNSGEFRVQLQRGAAIRR